jgi:hypothetical protein
MKSNPIYCRQAPLFKAIKYYNKSDDRKETYFILGYKTTEHHDYIYNLRINDKTGYIRPDYNLPVMDMVYVINNFDIRSIIVSLFTSDLDSRWLDVLSHIGEDSRNVATSN